MTLFDEAPRPTPTRAPVPTSEIDYALTAQIVVAWAGEAGEDARLGWWRSDLVSEYGGEDLFRRLLPHTWAWAALQGAREAAARKDAELRQRDHAPDDLITLFNLGFELDERLDERLQEHKRSGRPPREALPGLADIVTPYWNRANFDDWVLGHGEAGATATPTGRLVRGAASDSLELTIRRLVAALAPLGDAYPLPHLRRTA